MNKVFGYEVKNEFDSGKNHYILVNDARGNAHVLADYEWQWMLRNEWRNVKGILKGVA